MENKPDFLAFGRCAIETADTLAKRALVFVYFRSRFTEEGAKLDDVRLDFRTLGLTVPSPGRLRQILSKDRRTKRVAKDTWIIPADRFFDVESEFELDRCMPKEAPVKKASPSGGAKVKKPLRRGGDFIDKERMRELRKIVSPDYDLSRLVRICEEINSNFSTKNYISTILLVRTLLDHVAPIFGFKTFTEVSNSFKGSKSLKDSLQHLENSSRKIADGHLHTPIRKKEVLPTAAQVNFSQDLDVLLGEIVRILK